MSRRNVGRLLLPVAVLAVALSITTGLVMSKPEPARIEAVDRGVLVQTQRIERSLERFDIGAQGMVVPAREVTIQPQVSGRVLALNPDLVPGGLIAEGDVLLRIDPADYRLAVATANSGIAQAQASLALEQGRRAVAEREWALFRDDIGDVRHDLALVLREPQLQRAQAALDSARARLDRALLDLERTEIRAPFNALVLAEAVEVGQTVGPQSAAATLVGTDSFWVRASLQPFALALLHDPGAAVDIAFDIGGQRLHRQGRVLRTLGDLDPAGQMARILVEVADPLGLRQSTDGRSLLLGSYVDLLIAGQRPRDVVRLSRTWLHDGDTVHLYSDGRLQIRSVEVVWRLADAVLVGEGLSGGEQVVTSAIATPVAGMRLRIAGQPVPAPDGAAP